MDTRTKRKWGNIMKRYIAVLMMAVFMWTLLSPVTSAIGYDPDKPPWAVHTVTKGEVQSSDDSGWDVPSDAPSLQRSGPEQRLVIRLGSFLYRVLGHFTAVSTESVDENATPYDRNVRSHSISD